MNRMVLAVGLVAACAAGPEPIAVGERPCDHCHMVIMDARFAGELVTRTGKVHQFDDIGCLAAFHASSQLPPDQVHSLWVTDFRRPDSLIDATTAAYLLVDTLRTPMSSHLVAVPAEAADSLQAVLGGQRLTWAEITHEGGR